MNEKAAHISGDDNSHLPTGRPSADTNFVRREHATILKLPEPGSEDDEWAVRDLRANDDYYDLTGEAKRFENANVINSEREEYRQKGKKKVKIYETDEFAYRRAQEYAEKINTLPCCPEGTGFKNVGSFGSIETTWYECRSCGAFHEKSVVLESGVLG